MDRFQSLDLSPEDHANLRASPEIRGRVIAKVADQYRQRHLNREAMQIAEDILQMAATDAAVQVRRALVDILKDFSGLPRDIAIRLAHDVDVAEIAVPVIRVGTVFAEQDLLDLIATQCPQRQEAIARKPRLSEVISDALIATGVRPVVCALTENPGARISEQGYHAILEQESV